jgi:hypothetical protein
MDQVNFVDVDGSDILKRRCWWQWYLETSMVMVLIFWDADIDGISNRYHRLYRYLGRYITTSGFDIWYLKNVLIINGINISTIVIMSMSMSQPSTSMAPSTGDNDTIDDVLMVDPIALLADKGWSTRKWHNHDVILNTWHGSKLRSDSRSHYTQLMLTLLAHRVMSKHIYRPHTDRNCKFNARLARVIGSKGYTWR